MKPYLFLLNDTILLAIALVLSSYVVIYAQAQETTVNTTTTTQEQDVRPEIVGTGQEAVPVITANGTEVAQAAPAEAVNSLLNNNIYSSNTGYHRFSRCNCGNDKVIYQRQKGKRGIRYRSSGSQIYRHNGAQNTRAIRNLRFI